MVKEYAKAGVLVNSNGAIGADLTEYKLGFCMVLKSVRAYASNVC